MRCQSVNKERIYWGGGETKLLVRTWADRITGPAQDAVLVGIERTDLLGGWEERSICEAMLLRLSQ